MHTRVTAAAILLTREFFDVVSDLGDRYVLEKVEVINGHPHLYGRKYISQYKTQDVQRLFSAPITGEDADPRVTALVTSAITDAIKTLAARL